MSRVRFEVFHEVFGMRFVWFSLSVYAFEVFCPFWVLYNIKRGWDTPPGAHQAAPERRFGPAAASNVVPGALVPGGYAVATRCCPSVCSVLLCAYATMMRCHVARLPCPSWRALSQAYSRNIQSHRRQFSCPSFCLALSCSGRDEMFGQGRWLSFRRMHIVSPYCM